MSDQYFAPAPAAAPDPRTVELLLAELRLEMRTDAGVFSPRRVDPGTLVLLREAAPPPRSGDVLDLGCGYGPIALVLGKRAPGARVWAVDVNARALALCRANAEVAGLRNLTIVAPEEVPAGVRFAAIYSNPPIRIGRDPLRRLLQTWLERLDSAGKAYLVVQRHLGSDSLATWLTEHGWTVERLASKRAYRVLEVTRRAPPDRA